PVPSASRRCGSTISPGAAVRHTSQHFSGASRRINSRTPASRRWRRGEVPVVTSYVRRDLKIELFARGDDAVIRLTVPGRSQTETPLLRDVVDRAALGDDGPLRQWIVPAGVAAALASTRIEDFALVGVTISVSERSWAGIAWESFDPKACVVRASEVRPRVRQIPF